LFRLDSAENPTAFPIHARPYERGPVLTPLVRGSRAGKPVRRPIHPVVDWLFMKGGMSVVLFLMILAIGLLGAVFPER
jgi:hypothetical protein